MLYWTNLFCHGQIAPPPIIVFGIKDFFFLHLPLVRFTGKRWGNSRKTIPGTKTCMKTKLDSCILETEEKYNTEENGVIFTIVPQINLEIRDTWIDILTVDRDVTLNWWNHGQNQAGLMHVRNRGKINTTEENGVIFNIIWANKLMNQRATNRRINTRPYVIP